MCLVGVVVRRYIDFLILLIPTPQHPYFLFIFLNVFYIIYIFIMGCALRHYHNYRAL